MSCIINSHIKSTYNVDIFGSIMNEINNCYEKNKNN